MSRELLHDCLPYFLAIAIAVALLRLLVALSGARFQLSALKHLARDERGAVQSLSFVLTVPLFIMVLMFIVQLTQITIARLVVEYAAFAATRSAIVWIPANVDVESANRIGIRNYERDRGNFAVYEIVPVGTKANRIRLAAAMACMPICPSRAQRAIGPPPPGQLVDALYSAYVAGSEVNRPARWRVIRNKAEYALNRTRVEIEVEHPPSLSEPPLYWYWPSDEFLPDEIGWRDGVSVTVYHDFALLPGPGRLLAQAVERRDRVAERVVRRGGTWTYTLSATMTMQNEGQKSVRRYWQEG
jgi:hypothetical protein